MGCYDICVNPLFRGILISTKVYFNGSVMLSLYQFPFSGNLHFYARSLLCTGTVEMGVNPLPQGTLISTSQNLFSLERV
jgi:hypothetical protein